MILYVDEHATESRFLIHAAARGGSAENCDGVLRRYLDESVNAELCERLMTRTGAFWFDASGDLYEDEDWQPEAP